MQLRAILWAIGLSALVDGQTVGSDGVTTVSYPPTCTTVGSQTYAVTDSANVLYWYMCGPGSGGSAATTIGAQNWNDCFGFCDGYTGCSGFTYNQGQPLGAGPGNCVIKTLSPNFFTSYPPYTSTRIAGIVRAAICKIS